MIVLMDKNIHAAVVYDGRLFKVQQLSWPDAHGGAMRREIVRHPGAVLIVPVLDPQRLVMIRNYRLAADQTLWEFPAGKLESGEDPLHAAHRELEEETGFRAARMFKLGEFYTSPGLTDELMRVFVAEELSSVGQRLEPGEDIQVEHVSVSRALQMVGDGSLRDAKSIAGLLMLQSHQARNAA